MRHLHQRDPTAKYLYFIPILAILGLLKATKSCPPSAKALDPIVVFSIPAQTQPP